MFGRQKLGLREVNMGSSRGGCWKYVGRGLGLDEKGIFISFYML